MRQILQDVKTGETTVVEIPCPLVAPGHLLIRTAKSLISAGTERMLVEFGQANLLSKSRQQPDKVRMVMDKVRSDGLAPTIEAVRARLDHVQPMGYCNFGVVAEVGKGVTGFSLGDRVASNGGHAEMVIVPANLCAKVPDNVSDEAAAFTVIGAIALQGIRLVGPALGEAVVVTGLGLIGLMAVRLLQAHGCRTLGIDLDKDKLELARQMGAETVDLSRGEDPLAAAAAFSRGRGVDAVLITASTKSNEPIHQAAVMCRKRGCIVLVGVVGLDLSRADFYQKELTFQVSCSYGPGRYDRLYEERGQDYPVGFVRWTEQRNFEAVLDMMAGGRLDPAPLISHRFPFDRTGEAYEVLTRGSALGILLDYQKPGEKPDEELRKPSVSLVRPGARGTRAAEDVVVALIGAGNHATRVLIPALKKSKVRLKTIASVGGVSGFHAGRKFGFEETTCDRDGIFEDSDINAVVIVTRHDSHAELISRSLSAGKHVFAEKPLAITRDELSRIEAAYRADANPAYDGVMMVGFNRRFAPQVTKIKSLLSEISEPKSFVLTVNAGAVSPDHWIQDRTIGGGRLIGEACHFIDLLRFLAGSPIVSTQTTMIGEFPGMAIRDDKVAFTLKFADGSFGTVHYLANGHRSFPKERLEVFCAGRVLQLDNYRRMRGFGWPGFRRMDLLRQDKGNEACVAAFVSAIREGGLSPIPFAELVEVTRVSFDVAEAVID